MALTVTKVEPGAPPVFKVIEVTFDNSYTTGGLAITATQCGLNGIDTMIPEQPQGYAVQYIASTGCLLVRDLSDAHVHTENTAVSYTQNATTATVAAAAGAEVPNATDLSALTFRVLVVGQ